MFGFEECCDAVTYSDLGQVCLTQGWSVCLSDYRPVGALALNAFMYPYGLAPLSHVLLLVFSLFIVAATEGIDNGHKPNWLVSTAHHAPSKVLYGTHGYISKVVGAFLLLEFMFAGLASVNLTDAPAGVIAALAIYGFFKKNSLLFVLAGGVSVLVRAAYLYPMLLLAVLFLMEGIYSKKWPRVAVSLLFFLIVSLQYWLTWLNFGEFGFMDPSKVQYWQDFHFSSNLAGYDTLIPAAGHSWPSAASAGWYGLWVEGKWAELTGLFSSRIYFYFASYAPLGKVYLDGAPERVFSIGVLFLHLVALVFSHLILRRYGAPWRVWLPLSVILAQGLLIIPEQRFIFVIQLFLVALSYLWLLQAAKGWVSSRKVL